MATMRRSALLLACFLFGFLLLVTQSQEEESQEEETEVMSSKADDDEGHSTWKDAPGQPQEDFSSEFQDAAADDMETDSDAEGQVDHSQDEGTDEDDEEEDESEKEESVWTEEQLSSDQSRGLHQKIDLNNDGKVSLDEVLAFSQVSRKAIVHKESEELLASMDSDKDGKITLQELLEAEFGYSAPEEDELLQQPQQTPEQLTEDADLQQRKEHETEKFKVADANGDGFLDAEELPTMAYPELHDGVLTLAARHTLKERDQDGDGELTQAEFYENEVAGGEERELSMKEEFEKLDSDSSGKLNLEEFKVWESGFFHSSDAMSDLIQLADEDSDNHITAAELDAARPLLANSVASAHLMQWAEHYEL